MKSIMQRLAAFLRAKDGVSTVEFAIIVPVLLFIVAGIVDLGGALKAKFDLNSSISAASNFALLNAADVSTAKGSDLANKIATIAKGGLGNYGTILVSVNGGPGRKIIDGSSQATTGDGDADKCYCPSRAGGTVSFGTAATCGSLCSPSNGTAGKFVVISATKPHNSLFGGFGIMETGNVSVISVVQPK